jgi:hypothetical protein
VRGDSLFSLHHRSTQARHLRRGSLRRLSLKA